MMNILLKVADGPGCIHRGKACQFFKDDIGPDKRCTLFDVDVCTEYSGAGYKTEKCDDCRKAVKQYLKLLEQS